MSARPWMPLYIADYLADTQHLMAAESGAYLHLIMHYWRVGGLPQDDRSLARIAKLTGKQWHKYRPVLAAFFTSEWRHKRVDAELEAALRVSEKRSQSGHLGGTQKAANALKTNDASVASATILLEQKATQSQSPTEKKETQTSSAAAIAAEGASLITEILDLEKPFLAPCFTIAEPEVLPESDVDRLWRLGLPILVATSDKPVGSLRSMLGKWIKDAGNDAAAVLRAIQRSQDEQAIEPIAFINRIINPRNEYAARHFGSARTAPRSGTSHITAALAEIVERDARDREAGGVPQGFLTFDGATH